MSTTARIAATSTKDSGVTPDLCRSMWDRLGSRHMAIVELVVDERTEDVGDQRGVKLAITHIEPAVDTEVAEHLRELSRALYQRREERPTLAGSDEPSVGQVLKRGQVHLTNGDE